MVQLLVILVLLQKNIFFNNIDVVRKALEDNIIKYNKDIIKKKNEYKNYIDKMNVIEYDIRSISVKKEKLLTALTNLIK